MELLHAPTNGGSYFLSVTKWDNPLDPFDNPFPTPELTENFEAPIVPVPGAANAGKYYCIYTDSRPFGSSVYIATYNSVNQTLAQPSGQSGSVYSTGSSQLRLAVSKSLSDNSRDVYIIDSQNKLVKVKINSNGAVQTPTTIKNGASVGSGFLSSELELSHDGKKLAWAVHLNNEAIIHQYDLTSSQHITVQIAPGACQKIAGLEYLPNGNLAIAAAWNSPFTFLNGIVVFDPAFQGASIVSNAAGWQNAMIELGYGNGSLLFANNGAQIIAISTATLAIAPIQNITIGSSGLSSPYGSFYSSVGGALPDQIDGAFYTDPSSCSGGGNPPINRPSHGGMPKPDFYFEPVITTIPVR